MTTFDGEHRPEIEQAIAEALGNETGGGGSEPLDPEDFEGPKDNGESE